MAKLSVIPAGHKVVETSAGTFLEKIRRRRRRFKLPAKTRNKIAASARKIKIPVLTLGANAVPLMGLATFVTQDLGSGIDQFTMGRRFFNRVVTPYTGIVMGESGPRFQPKELMFGLVPNLIVGFIRKSRVLQSTNQRLAATGLPFRLS